MNFTPLRFRPANPGNPYARIRTMNLLLLLACLRTLDTVIVSAWAPKGGAVICDRERPACAVGYEDGTGYEIVLPKSPAFVLERAEKEIYDSPKAWANWLALIKEPRSGEKVYLNAFMCSKSGLFVRAASSGDDAAFTPIEPRKLPEGAFAELAKKRVAGTFKLLSGNMARRNFPEGWDAARYAESVKKRLAGCMELGAEPKRLADQAEGLLR